MLQSERQMVAAAARRLADEGLVTGTAGNVSLRCGECILITATRTELARVTAADVLAVHLDGRPLAGETAGRQPSTELAIHVGAHAQPGIRAIVHAHPPVATALSLVLDEIPVIHYGMLDLGGSVPVAAYATPGTARLAQVVLEALHDRRAVLMAHHGSLTVGATLEEAVAATLQLEWFAQLYWRASTIGPPAVLDEHDLAEWRQRAAAEVAAAEVAAEL